MWPTTLRSVDKELLSCFINWTRNICFFIQTRKFVILSVFDTSFSKPEISQGFKLAHISHHGTRASTHFLGWKLKPVYLWHDMMACAQQPKNLEPNGIKQDVQLHCYWKNLIFSPSQVLVGIQRFQLKR